MSKRNSKNRQNKQAKHNAKSRKGAIGRQKARLSKQRQVIDRAVHYHKAGDLPQAEELYRQVLKKNPQQPDALHLLGLIAHQVGKHGQALEMISKALAFKPDFAEAHNSLGNTLRGLGQLEKASASYRKAIALQPKFAIAHCNLGLAYKELGRLGEAVASYQCAIALRPQEDQFWHGFSICLQDISFASVDQKIFRDLLSLLERRFVNPRDLVRPVLSALRQHSEFSRLLAWSQSDQSRGEFTYAQGAETISAIPLFLRLIELVPINDIEVELMLIALRRGMLLEGLSETDNQELVPFSIALALHCFVNEYVFYESAEETEAIEYLQRQIVTLLDNNQEVPSSYVLTLSAYRPLNHLPFARKLTERKWLDDINRVFVQQIEEPAQEFAIRAEFSGQTSIDDTISRKVREQYEENPYPRWVKSQFFSKAETISNCLMQVLPNVDLGAYQDVEKPEILIAGCGTGLQALSAATRYLNSCITAVDLSLSSLSYAVRKTRELGCSNIEYSQADILKLGSLQRKFDLIVCSGVLHHLEDPMVGWRVLVDNLRPNGLMNIGLYSELARRSVVQGRTLIAKKGYAAKTKDIRQFRSDVLSEESNSVLIKLLDFRDFFSTSECRDLLFHVQEHRFTLVQIEEALQSLGLKFLGFELSDQRVFKSLEAANPSTNQALTSLPLWHQYELQNPDTFIGMYQFWCQKM